MTVDTKTALLNSAESAARCKGFDGFSYADLAAEVGIRKASIHYHFPSKADLSVALIARDQEIFRQVCAKIDTEKTAGGARLAALIERYADALNGGQSLCLCVAFSVSRDGLSDETITHMAAFRRMMLDWLETVFAKGQADETISDVTDPKREAAATLALLEGAQLSARAGRDVALFNAATAVLQNRIK